MLRAAIGELVARAQAAGAIRADIGPADVSMLFSGVAHATAIAGELQPVLRERYVRIILDGLRPNDARRASRASARLRPAATDEAAPREVTVGEAPRREPSNSIRGGGSRSRS